MSTFVTKVELYVQPQSLAADGIQVRQGHKGVVFEILTTGQCIADLRAKLLLDVKMLGE